VIDTRGSARDAFALTVKSYAYQDDHTPIAAGATGIPEPSSGSLELTAVARGRRAQRAAAV
jgi:hypothetical protein